MLTFTTLLPVHQYFGYLMFIFALVVLLWSLFAGASPLPRAVGGAFAGLLDLQALLGIVALLSGAAVAWIHPILGILAAAGAHLGARQGRRTFGSNGGARTARWYYLFTFLLILAAIGIASM